MVRDVREFEGALISDIYAALLGHGDWQSFLDRLTTILPNGKATLFYHDFAARSGGLSINAGIDPDQAAAYKEHYAARNPWMPKALTRPIGLGVRSEKMLPHSDLLRTEFFADFLRPQGLCTGVGVTMFRDSGCNFMLSLLSGPTDDAEADAAADLLGRLAPHLRQAFAYYRGDVAGPSRAPTLVNATTEALGVAFLAIGIGRQILSLNALGRDLLTSGDYLGHDGKGRITTRISDLAEALDHALQSAVRGEAPGKRTVAITSRDKAGMLLRVTLVVPELQPFERYFAGPCVLLLVDKQRPRHVPTEQALRSAFGLTPAQARLAVAIAKGQTIRSAADELRISNGTARSHLKSIFAKMDVHRQAELVAKVHDVGEQ